MPLTTVWRIVNTRVWGWWGEAVKVMMSGSNMVAVEVIGCGGYWIYFEDKPNLIL